MKIVMFGPPGSGKGTQAVQLAEYFKVPHISTGDMFRAIMKQETELGKMVKELVGAGKLISDDITAQVLQSRLDQDDAQNGFILDGYPRTVDQAKYLKSVTEINAVIDLIVKDETVVERLSTRETFDAVTGKTIRREDDKPEVVKRRLEVYHKQTSPLEKHYKKEGLLVEIDGEQEVEKVFSDIIEKVVQ